MDKKPRLGSDHLEWIRGTIEGFIIRGMRSIFLIICLSFLFYLYADFTIVKLVVTGAMISFAWLIKKGVLMDIGDISKRIRSLENKRLTSFKCSVNISLDQDFLIALYRNKICQH